MIEVGPTDGALLFIVQRSTESSSVKTSKMNDDANGINAVWYIGLIEIYNFNIYIAIYKCICVTESPQAVG